MAKLTEHEYEEYIQLLKAWVDAEKALEGLAEADAGEAQRAREARAALQGFRERYGLDAHERELEEEVEAGKR